MKKFSHNNLFYFVVAIAAALINIFWIIKVKSVPYSDFTFYHKAAIDIAKGKSWGNTYTTMGYSIVLAVFYKLFGTGIIVAKVLNILLSLLNIILIGKILKNLKLTERDRKLIFLTFAIFPSNIFYNSLLANEIIFTTVLLTITYLYLSKIKNKWIYIGVLCAADTMIKPYFIVFFAVIMLTELLTGTKVKLVIKNSMIVLLTTVICISPWIYRNSKLMKQFTFVSNNGGIVLYLNNNSQNYVGRWMDPASIQNSIVNTDEYKSANMTQKNKLASKEAKKWILSHPIHFIYLGNVRLINTYLLGDDIIYTFHGAGLHLNWVIIIFIIATFAKFTVYASALIYVLFRSFKVLRNFAFGKFMQNDKFEIYILILFYMFSCIYFFTEGQSRYSFPLNFAAIYASYSLIKRIFNFRIRKEINI